ncbi:hypothetical protein GCM10010233_00380 [Streptomyces pseudogriseolus]|uniref:Uncharacterized protein n=1 Tax=Streptomyces pseudogriseolus TaxID=36817 RepID=A0ABQ2TN92_STREZ|nr:hypothetical protein GCM10010233_00380 [Streptomyces gancidicus]GGS74669.1 hypothetical protein GCM10010285_61720 [Streptomyces rubiginosus]
MHDVDGVALGGEALGEGEGEALFVLDDQESHGTQGRKGKLKITSGCFSFGSASVGEIEGVESRPTREEPT